MESSSFSIKSISIVPEVSAVSSPVKIEMDFQSPHSLTNAVWKVFYQIDTIRKRKLLEVLSLPPSNFSEGINSLSLEIPSIDVDFNSNVNITAGVLLLTLSCENEELLGINMIVQIMPKEGEFFKTIFSPLE